MSYVVNASAAPFCYSKDHPCGVRVTVFFYSADRAYEGSLGQVQVLPGSRETPGTCHRRVCGPYQHHLPAGPPAVLDQGSLQGAHAVVGGFPGHGGLGEELRLEVLDRDQVMGCGDPACPLPSVVLVLPRGVLVRLRSGPPRTLVAAGLRTAEFSPSRRPRRLIARCARARAAAARLRCAGHGKSNAGSVATAGVLTPQSMPMLLSAGGSGVTSRVTTNDAYQWPRLSRKTRADVGAEGGSRDQVNGSVHPAGRERPRLR